MRERGEKAEVVANNHAPKGYSAAARETARGTSGGSPEAALVVLPRVNRSSLHFHFDLRLFEKL